MSSQAGQKNLEKRNLRPLLILSFFMVEPHLVRIGVALFQLDNKEFNKSRTIHGRYLQAFGQSLHIRSILNELK